MNLKGKVVAGPGFWLRSKQLQILFDLNHPLGVLGSVPKHLQWGLLEVGNQSPRQYSCLRGIRIQILRTVAGETHACTSHDALGTTLRKDVSVTSLFTILSLVFKVKPVARCLRYHSELKHLALGSSF